MIDPRTLKPYADGVSDGITVSEEEHATTYHGEDGSYPIPVIQDHELRIRKLEELLTTPTIRNADAADALRYFQHPGQTVSPLKESAGLWHPYKDWKAKDSAPVEPAPGSDAEHPPLGYRLAKVAEKREPGYVFWDGEGWIEGESTLFGSPIDPWHSSPCANPITANEGDSQKAGLSDKIAESVVQDLQPACYDRDELRATVERLTAELETTKRLLAESLVERDRLKNLHDARKVRIEGFRDVLRERLGDLV